MGPLLRGFGRHLQASAGIDVRRFAPGFALCLALGGAGLAGCADGSEEVFTGGGSGGSGGMGGPTSTGGNMSGGGGSSSSGGTGGGSTGGTTSQLTLKGPVERDGLLVLEFGDTYVSIDPALGGRVTSLRQAGVEVLSGRDVNESNWGSTYWTSPQSDWSWPPVAEVDSEPYAVTINGAGVSLVSAPADVGSQVGGKNVTVTKRFTANFALEAIDVEYMLTNVGAAAITIASWEISRVPGGGLTFYPTGDNEITPVEPHAAVPVTHQNDVTWFDSATFPVGSNTKLNADGQGGWLAHVANGVLFLKTFEDLPVSSQVPGEGEVEIYADGAGSYVEVENQGPNVTIEPGASSTYKVRWLVRKLPADVTVAVGSETLVAFVESLVN
jgi:hypothetical protein